MDNFYADFEKCVKNQPDAKAILYCDNNGVIHELMYSEVSRISDDISRFLRNFVKTFTCVGILVEYNLLLPVLIVGLQKYDCPFYCVDIMNNENLMINFKQFGLEYILSCKKLEKKLSENNAALLSSFDVLGHTVDLWRLNQPGIETEKNICYVIQTSGTTGESKTVRVTHDCIMSNIRSFRKILKMDSMDIIYFGTPVTFDPYIIEMFLSLTTGACLLVVPQNVCKNPNLFLPILFPLKKIHSGVTFLQMPPSKFLCFPEHYFDKILCGDTTLKYLALGGEKFPEKVLQFKHRSSKLRIFNFYGITEVSCWASVKELGCLESEISLGEPLEDTIFDVRNAKDDVGELYIGSSKRICCIGNEKVLINTPVFRSTGDLVHARNGNLFYVGRKNSCIKRFGVRVCLTEIEKNVFQETNLNTVCVWDDEHSKLILFVVLGERDKIVLNKIIDKLRIKLLNCLSKELNPDIIEPIHSIPLTRNGKTDVKHLRNLIKLQKPEHKNPLNVFFYLLNKYFGLDEASIKPNCTFTEMGGNSILAIQISSEFDTYFDNATNILTMLLENRTFTECRDSVKSLQGFKVLEKIKETPKRIKLSDPKGSLDCRVKWRYDLGACVDSTAVCFKHSKFGDLLAIGCHSNVFAIFFPNGEILSKLTLPDAIEGSACVSPCTNFAMFGCNDGVLYCIRVESAEVIWQFETGAGIKTSPSLHKLNIIFGSYDKYIYCVTIKTGGLVWRRNVGESLKSNPIVSNDAVYIASLLGTCLSLDAGTGNVLWQYQRLQPVFGSPCIIDGRCVIWADVKGNISCFSCGTGEKLWTHETNGLVYSSLCQIGNSIHFGSHDCHLYRLECYENVCRETLKIHVGGQITATPCIFYKGDKQYVVVACNNGRMNFYDTEGLLMQVFELQGELFSSPVVYNDNIVIGCRDNSLYCIHVLFR